MRRMIGLVLVLVFFVIASLGLAFFMIRVNRAGELRSDKISEIEKCPQKSLVTLSLPNGQSFSFSSTSQKLDGIQVSDRITLREGKGRAADIKKTDTNMANTDQS